MTPERGTREHVQQALRDWGVPDYIVDCIHISDVHCGCKENPKIFYERLLFAEYRYYDGIEQPLFHFHHEGERYNKQIIERGPDGMWKPNFRLMIGPRNRPGFLIRDYAATIELSRFIWRNIVDATRDPGLTLQHNSQAVYQGGAYDSPSKWCHLEFFKPPGAQAVIDFMNANYHPPGYTTV